MKLTCTQENLVRGLAIVARLSEKSIHLPILQNVLLQARKSGLVLTTTNLELGITTTVRGKIDEEGDFTVPARLLADFVGTLKKENVSIVLDDQTLKIQGENHQTAIRGVAASDFPTLPEIGEAFDATIQATEFKKLLSQSVFAMSADESRPELNGAYLQFKDGRAVLAATDSFRLAEKAVPAVIPGSGTKACIVPARTVHEVLRVAEIEDDGPVTIRINDTQIEFVRGETRVISRIVAGEYPDYQQIIPKSFTNAVEFSIAEMVQAIKTTALFCKQGINDIRISLDKRFDDITIQAENSTHGKNVSNVKSRSKNQEMDIVFNYRYLLDGLMHMESEFAILQTNEATSPALVKPSGDESLLYIIMPIRQ